MHPIRKDPMDGALRLALRLWLVVTAAFALANGALYLLHGSDVFRELVQVGAYSLLPLTLISVGVVWLSAGISLFLLRNRTLRAHHGLLTLYVLLIVVLHTNILRERSIHGDFEDYLRAAHDLANGAALHDRYLYPPFAATVLSFLLPLGDGAVGYISWLVNVLALGLLSILLPRALQRYGFGERVSLLLSFVFLVVNVPLLRTLEYLQVNVNVVCLTLVSLLAYPRLLFLSAFALALAVHLKTSPIVLAIPFLLSRDWRWTAWFLAGLGGVALLTVLPYGWAPFANFWWNTRHIYNANSVVFRETSVDSLFRSLGVVFGFAATRALWGTLVVKMGILAAAGFTLWRVERKSPFVGRDEAGHTVYNLFPVVVVLMLLLSPLLWEHHPVLAVLPYLVVLKRLQTSGEWALYGFAYFLEYLLPTFDFFPWSFGRLLSPLILLWLLYATLNREEEGSFRRGVAALQDGLSAPQKRRSAEAAGKPR